MNKEFHIIVVDNDTEEITGSVTDFFNFGFNVINHGKNMNLPLNTVDDLLNWSQETDHTIYYMIGGVRIPLNQTTHKNNHYFRMIGWLNITPAESVIFGVLQEAKYTGNRWVSSEYLQEMLIAFGFAPTSLRMLLFKLRKKLEFSNFRIKNRNRVGYRLVDPVNDPINDFIMKESLAQSDFWILFQDNKLRSFVTEKIEQFIVGERLTGGQILKGWQGLTRTEAEIFFELLKHRGEWVTYKQLLALPWTTRFKKENSLTERYLKTFVWRIRKKVARADEVIETKNLQGYCLNP